MTYLSDGVLTKEEFAQLVGVSSRTVERLTQKNKIQPICSNKRHVRYGYAQLKQFYCLKSADTLHLPHIYKLEAFAEKVRLSTFTLKKMDKDGSFVAFKDIRGNPYYTEASLDLFYNFAAQNLPAGSQACSSRSAASILKVAERTLINWQDTGELKAYVDICSRKYYLKSDIIELARVYAPKN